ncbi:NAD(+)/NADH kinase [Candidatus Weimeria sp. HCP3S3_B5]|uniref:NAD(+)/NADH kinase n=1 Tax=Candidatus Weimeria sp. HCP3S3_B5 TaxID=3438871 RepID=UPI002A96965E|nr:NAD(+)/NADH kinase [Lachnospiraceae bacterium]MDY6352792.1 NAD(+)/NADH kinase [Lachnospiraceae bacterium]
MKNFLILTKEDSPRMESFIREIITFLNDNGAKGQSAVLRKEDASRPIEVFDGCECIITVGGDGTMIRAAVRTVEAQVPLIGINKGHLGYLCDLDQTSYREALKRLIEGDYDVEERMLLEGRVVSEDGSPKSGSIVAVNDIVITSHNGLQVVHLSVDVNGERLTSFNGDGIIFATPTGSTAYNLSTGGPIVDPKTSLILMTPLNAHVVGMRSIVLDDTAMISARVTRRNQDELNAAAAFDGTTSIMLKDGDMVQVKRSGKTVKFVRLSRINFLDRIRSKLPY